MLWEILRYEVRPPQGVAGRGTEGGVDGGESGEGGDGGDQRTRGGLDREKEVDVDKEGYDAL